MTIRIEIERMAKDSLTCQRWIFRFWDDYATLTLAEYIDLYRPSRRHGFRVKDRYYNIDRRNNTVLIDDVPLPDDVARDAFDKFVSQIKVVKENLAGGYRG